MSIRTHSLVVLALLLGTFFIITFSRDLLDLMSSRERIAKEQAEVAQLEEEQQELASELNQVMSDEFVEKEAREKLLLSKPGETVILLPSDEHAGEKDSSQNNQDGEDELANWEKWLRLFDISF